jgi:solute carrier family 25 folate transporter 32
MKELSVSSRSSLVPFVSVLPRAPLPFRSPGLRTRRARVTPELRTDCLSTDTVKSVWRYSGLKGFYRGLGPTMLGYLPTWAIYFAVYDGIKTTFGEVPLGVQAPPPPAPSKFGGPAVKADDRGTERVLYPAAQPKGYQPVVREHPWGLHIMSAMIAGAASTTCTNPLWVIKTRFMVRFISRRSEACFDTLPIQTQTWDEPRYLHTIDAARTIYRSEGVRAFYRGLLPSLLGIAHVAVQFPLYEQLKIWARTLDSPIFHEAHDSEPSVRNFQM